MTQSTNTSSKVVTCYNETKKKEKVFIGTIQTICWMQIVIDLLLLRLEIALVKTIFFFLPSEIPKCDLLFLYLEPHQEQREGPNK